MVGVVERVEASVYVVVAVVFVFIEEGVAGDRLDRFPALGSDQLDAKGFDVDSVGGAGILIADR